MLLAGEVPALAKGAQQASLAVGAELVVFKQNLEILERLSVAAKETGL